MILLGNGVQSDNVSSLLLQLCNVVLAPLGNLGLVQFHHLDRLGEVHKSRVSQPQRCLEESLLAEGARMVHVVIGGGSVSANNLGMAVCEMLVERGLLSNNFPAKSIFITVPNFYNVKARVLHDVSDAHHRCARLLANLAGERLVSMFQPVVLPGSNQSVFFDVAL
jgi:hypothetical protein